MIKAATLTFHRSHNYGSVLQAYALENALNSFDGIECEIIDFYPPNFEHMYTVYEKNKSIRAILKNIIVFMNRKERLKRYKNFESFQQKYKLSNKKYKEKIDWKEINKSYDAVICGSDQIWCTSGGDFSLEYFLPGADNVKKISYAPSLGYSQLDEYEFKDEVKKCLLNFDYISVRETDGKKQINKLLQGQKKIDINLDPTFLLPVSEYDNIASERIIKGDYIFFYSVSFRKQNAEILKYISDKLNIKVYTLSTFVSSYRYKNYGIKILDRNSPEDFLSLIKNAKYVFSSSFHGNVFSIIFRKNFYALRDVYNDADIFPDSRIETMLNSFNLQDRQISKKNYKEVDFNTDINYDEDLIKKRTSESINNLLSAIMYK